MLDWEIIAYFLLAVVLISIPAFVFYRIGLDVGITRGIRRQVLRELMASGIIEDTDVSLRSPTRTLAP